MFINYCQKNGYISYTELKNVNDVHIFLPKKARSEENTHSKAEYSSYFLHLYYILFGYFLSISYAKIQIQEIILVKYIQKIKPELLQFAE